MRWCRARSCSSRSILYWSTCSSMSCIPPSIRGCHMANRNGWIGRLLGNRSASIGLVIVALFVIMGILGSLSITPYPPNEQHPKAADRLQPPGFTYLMGSDQFGRDILSRVIRGTIYSLRVVFVSVAIATVLGTAIGMISGYVGGP